MSLQLQQTGTEKQQLTANLQQLTQALAEYKQRADQLERIKQRFETLTPREREVMVHVTAGLMNKQVAAQLGVSEITVKIHRGQAMRKMGARSLADLVRMAELLGVRQGS